MGRQRAFEVEINGELVFSKLGEGEFPDFDQVVARVVEASQGKAVQKMTSKK